jgi:phospholipid-binding lipoprotein MlaA
MNQKIIITVIFIWLSSAHQATAHDEYETFNRNVESLNSTLDKAVVKPVTEGYVSVTPDPVRNAVSNFVNNLAEPITIINDLLQGKVTQSIQDSARFIFNSTFGLFGLIDIATPMGLQAHDEDFGQTFAVWGWTDSDYLNLPLLGPSSVRDATGKPLSLIMTNYGIPFTLAKVLSVREKILPIDPMLDASPDRYVFIRDAYQQQRSYLIRDGQSVSNDTFKSFDFSE